MKGFKVFSTIGKIVGILSFIASIIFLDFMAIVAFDDEQAFGTLFLAFLTFIFALIGIIFGGSSRARIKKDPTPVKPYVKLIVAGALCANVFNLVAGIIGLSVRKSDKDEQPKTTDTADSRKNGRKTKIGKYGLYKGIAVLTAFFFALFLGAEMVTSVSDYRNMVNDFLGVKSSTGAAAESYAFRSEYSSTAEMLTERKRIAEQLSEEGSVLLKNENGALPIGGSSPKVTILGSRAYTYDNAGKLRDTSLTLYGGIVGSPIREQTVTTTEGTIKLPITLEKALTDQNVAINPRLKDYYSTKPFPSLVKGSEANGSSGGPFSANEPNVTLSDCGDYRNYSDAAIVVIGRSSGEGREYVPGYENGVEDKTDGSKSALSLSKDETNLIAVADAVSDKVIVLIASAVAMEIGDLKYDDRVDSILWIGLPGSYGMNGVARLLTGKASPSGKLSDTYAVDASASPAAQNFGVTAQNGEGRFVFDSAAYTDNDNSHYIVLAEDIYFGYYYYETRYADCVEQKGNASAPVGLGYGEKTASKWDYSKEVAYTFGYGLSYSTFTQKIVENSLKVDMDKKTVSVDVLVKNTGSVAAKNVVELFVQSPYTAYDVAHKVEKSAVQLVGFEKVLLEPDEQKTVTVTADMKYFASYDKTATHDGVVGGYILENADYYFAIGNGAHEALNNVLLKKGVDSTALYYEGEQTLNPDGAVVWRPELPFDTDGVNAEFLSTSASGTVIENQLEDADYNYYAPGTVTYLTRSDWQATFPKAYVNLPVQSGFTKYLDSKVYTFGTSAAPDNVKFGVDHSEEEDDEGNPMEPLLVTEMKMADYSDERWDYLIQQITFDEAWALSPYGGTSCNPFLSVGSPEVWQIDGPNGNVTRGIGSKADTSGPMAVSRQDANYSYISSDMCCEPIVAATFNKQLLHEQGEIFGEDSLWSKNTIAWAPGMNLHRNPFNSRNHEYYSEDPVLTNIMGKNFVEGGVSKGAILAAKHFAFNFQESFREGLCQFVEEQSAREMELKAFQSIAEDVCYENALGNKVAGLGLMTSFSRIGAAGVNAHTGLMKNILRKEWGFKGLSSTDMVVGGRFFNPQDSVVNNVTFMATSNAENLLNNFWPEYNNKNKVKSDGVMLTALYENMHYYMYAVANSNALNGFDANSVVGGTLYWWQYVLKVLYWANLAATLTLIVLATLKWLKGDRAKNPDDEEKMEENA